LIAWLWASPALATQLAAVEVPCPGGEATATYNKLISQNTLGGWDSDGAKYSTAGQYRTHALSACPDSGLTLFGQDLAAGLGEHHWEALRPVAETLSSGGADGAALEVWDRYERAAAFYSALGRDKWFTARLYVQASWTVRDTAVGVYRGLQGPLHARLLIEGGRGELKKDLSLSDRKVVLFNLARVAYRGGYLADTERFLKELDTLSGSFTEAERAAVRALRRAQELEPRLQERAIAALNTFLAGAEAATLDRAQATYLLADLSRRRGATEAAIKGYDAVVRDDDAPDQLRSLSRYLSAELRGQEPWTDTRLQDLTDPPM